MLDPPFEADITCGLGNGRAEWIAWDRAARAETTVAGLWIGKARTGAVTVAVSRYTVWNVLLISRVVLLFVLALLVAYLVGMRIRRKQQAARTA